MGTATLLTPSELRGHVETDLSEGVLQSILDAEETEIIRRYGAHATQTDLLPGGELWLVLRRTPVSFTSVTETVNTTSTVLAADDYRHWGGGRLERLGTGTNARSEWGDRVSVVYVPEARSDQRKLVLVQLALLAIQYQGVQREAIGGNDYNVEYLDHLRERERLMRSLAPRGGMGFA